MRTFLLIILILAIPSQDRYTGQREKMVETQIQNRGISDPEVLRAMRTVPRHLFVPPDRMTDAYNDAPLGIGYGQTISQPYIVAYMTDYLDLEPGDKVFEVGTGSGYQAAILSEIVEQVYTIEIIKELALSAKKRLISLGYKNVNVFSGDGYYGLEDYAPYDAIMVTAAAEFIPPPLIKQLKEGGKMIIPVGSPFFTQQLVLVEKKNGRARTRNLLPVRFVPFTRE